VAAFRAGSSVAFEETQKLYSKRLYKQIVSITRSHEGAEDALQDTFLPAFLARDSFEGRSHLCTWLTRIAINSALMVVRRRHANVRVSLMRPSESGVDVYEFEIRDSATSPEEICDLNQRFNRLFSAIERLDFISRTVIENRVAQEVQ
jgi:RNA polymerase sigma-70 factor (ECF subfamily)